MDAAAVHLTSSEAVVHVPETHAAAASVGLARVVFQEGADLLAQIAAGVSCKSAIASADSNPSGQKAFKSLWLTLCLSPSWSPAGQNAA